VLGIAVSRDGWPAKPRAVLWRRSMLLLLLLPPPLPKRPRRAATSSSVAGAARGLTVGLPGAISTPAAAAARGLTAGKLPELLPALPPLSPDPNPKPSGRPDRCLNEVPDCRPASGGRGDSDCWGSIAPPIDTSLPDGSEVGRSKTPSGSFGAPSCVLLAVLRGGALCLRCCCCASSRESSSLDVCRYKPRCGSGAAAAALLLLLPLPVPPSAKETFLKLAVGAHNTLLLLLFGPCWVCAVAAADP
jgi:hypothetical protein